MGLLSIRRERKIEIGAVAPDFEAETTDGQTFRLSELRGRPVLLAFLPCEWWVSGSPDAARLGAAFGLEHRIIMDATQAITRQFASALPKAAGAGVDQSRPSAVLVGHDGRVLFAARCQDSAAFVEPDALLAALGVERLT